MQLQIALNQLSLDDAVSLAKDLALYADWIEVGTSLIKEFGMESVRRMRQALPQKPILADMQTNDEGRYEFDLCFAAGADAATVMGNALHETVATCVDVAKRQGKQVMLDMLATSAQRQIELLKYSEAIFEVHISKEIQETGIVSTATIMSQLPYWVGERKVAVAGGITLDDIPLLGARLPETRVIVGSSIVKAPDPIAAAKEFVAAIEPFR